MAETAARVNIVSKFGVRVTRKMWATSPNPPCLERQTVMDGNGNCEKRLSTRKNLAARLDYLASSAEPGPNRFA